VKTHWRRWMLPDWMVDREPDASHPHRRRFTPRYRRKRQLVKVIWICSGLIMILSPALNLTLTLILATSFLSFIVLDETA